MNGASTSYFQLKTSYSLDVNPKDFNKAVHIYFHNKEFRSMNQTFIYACI